MRYCLILLTILLLIICASPFHAVVIHVPGDSTTIQGGINGCSDGDTVMVAPGTYHEHDIDFLGKAITVISEQGPDSTIINGGHDGHVVMFRSGESSAAVLSGFTITNGEGAWYYSAKLGGGIYCEESSPTITNNIITGNDASTGLTYTDAFGGGIASYNSSPLITNNIIAGNSVYATSKGESYGGGIYCYNESSSNSPIIRNNVIIGNSSTYQGGGIACERSSPTIVNNVVEANYNGGIYNRTHSSPIISNNVITNNLGLGIACWSSCSPVISYNIISRNTAESGGGIRLSGGSPIIQNNTITGNSARGSGYYDGKGAGIKCSSGCSPMIQNNTITGNFATQMGGGIYCEANASPTITNTIIWGNTAPTGSEICLKSVYGPSILTISYSNVKGGQDSVYVCGDCTLNWGDGMIDADPAFRYPASDDFHLMATACGDSLDSPCIDAGDPALIDRWLDCSWGLGTDRSDMGAYGGGEPVVGIGDRKRGPVIPRSLSLSQNYPNPFNPSTTIAFDLHGTAVIKQRVSLTIYDIRGRLVRKLIDQEKEPGTYQVHWDGRDDNGEAVSSGVYLYRIEAGDFISTRKMILVR
jgi:hypothetical protein